MLNGCFPLPDRHLLRSTGHQLTSWGGRHLQQEGPHSLFKRWPQVLPGSRYLRRTSFPLLFPAKIVPPPPSKERVRFSYFASENTKVSVKPVSMHLTVQRKAQMLAWGQALRCSGAAPPLGMPASHTGGPGFSPCYPTLLIQPPVLWETSMEFLALALA